MKNVIYKIVNLVNDKFYVGSTNNSKIRFRQHRRLLRGNRHHCKHLQAAWNKYGEAKFSFDIIEQLPEDADLWAAEDVWLLQHVGKEHCYNTGRSADAPMRGRTGKAHPNFGKAITVSARAAMSKTLKDFYAADYNNHPRVGTTHSEATKQKISDHRKGKMAGSEHYRFGQTVSDEVKEKIGAAQRGKSKTARIISPEGKAKIRAAAEAGHYASFTGKHHTEASRKLMGQGIVVMPSGRRFDTITEMRAVLDIPIATVHRALKADRPIALGTHKGVSFQYQDPEREAARVQQAAELKANTPKKKTGRPAGQANESQQRAVHAMPEDKVYASVSAYLVASGRSRKAVYEMLKGIQPKRSSGQGWTLKYV